MEHVQFKCMKLLAPLRKTMPTEDGHTVTKRISRKTCYFSFSQVQGEETTLKCSSPTYLTMSTVVIAPLWLFTPIDAPRLALDGKCLYAHFVGGETNISRG